MDEDGLYLDASVLRPATTQLDGDCSALDELPQAIGANELERITAALFRSVAIGAGYWAELSLMGYAAAGGRPGQDNRPGLTPADWLQLNDSFPMVRSFKRMRDYGLVTLQDGYACPTQKLIDLILGRVA